MSICKSHICEKSRKERQTIKRNYKLLELRLKANMTQTEVGKALNVQQSTVGRWEHSPKMPPKKYHAQLCKLYGCTVDDLKGE